MSVVWLLSKLLSVYASLTRRCNDCILASAQIRKSRLLLANLNEGMWNFMNAHAIASRISYSMHKFQSRSKTCNASCRMRCDSRCLHRWCIDTLLRNWTLVIVSCDLCLNSTTQLTLLCNVSTQLLNISSMYKPVAGSSTLMKASSRSLSIESEVGW